MLTGDVIDQFQHGHGLANTSTTKQTDFTAFGKRTNQVNDLNASFQQVATTSLFVIRRWFAVNWHAQGFTDRALFIDRAAQHVHDSAQGGFAHWHRNWLLSIADPESTGDTFRTTHRDGAHDTVAQLLLYFQSQAITVDNQCVINLGDFIPREFNVNDRTNYLYDTSATHRYILLLSNVF